MADYIDRQAAIEAACKGFCHPGARCPDVECREQTKFIREIPSADVVPVVHGKWEHDGHHIRCNQCGTVICRTDREGDMIPRNFCPNCGARMDGERREE